MIFDYNFGHNRSYFHVILPKKNANKKDVFVDNKCRISDFPVNKKF